VTADKSLDLMKGAFKRFLRQYNLVVSQSPKLLQASNGRDLNERRAVLSIRYPRNNTAKWSCDRAR